MSRTWSALPPGLQGASSRKRRKTESNLNVRMDRLVARLDTAGHSRSSSSAVSTHDPSASSGVSANVKGPQPDPLPAWLFDTFSRLEPGHPLRSLITPPRPQVPARHLLQEDPNAHFGNQEQDPDPMFAYSISRPLPENNTPLFISDIASQTDHHHALDINAQALPFSTPGPGAHAHSRLLLSSLQETDDYDDDPDSDPPAYDFSSLSHVPFSTPGPVYPPQDHSDGFSGSGSSSDVHYAGTGIDFRWEPFDRKGIERQTPADHKDLIDSILGGHPDDFGCVFAPAEVDDDANADADSNDSIQSWGLDP